MVDATTRARRARDNLAELNKYTNNKDGKDPWGNEYMMLCGESLPPGVRRHRGVLDGRGRQGRDTNDDIKSWDAR